MNQTYNNITNNQQQATNLGVIEEQELEQSQNQNSQQQQLSFGGINNNFKVKETTNIKNQNKSIISKKQQILDQSFTKNDELGNQYIPLYENFVQDIQAKSQSNNNSKLINFNKYKFFEKNKKKSFCKRFLECINKYLCCCLPSSQNFVKIFSYCIPTFLLPENIVKRYNQILQQVTTQTVISRMKAACNPFSDPFFEINNQAFEDLYGPFWIAITLIQFLQVTGNAHVYMQYPRKYINYFNYNDDWFYTASVLVISLNLIVPIILKALLKVISLHQMPIIQIYCLYGYSFAVFIPASILCILPLEGIQWLSLIVSMMISSLFISRNIQYQIKDHQNSQGFLIDGSRFSIIYLVILAIQILTIMAMKYVFYKQIFHFVNYNNNNNPYDNNFPKNTGFF